MYLAYYTTTHLESGRVYYTLGAFLNALEAHKTLSMWNRQQPKTWRYAWIYDFELDYTKNISYKNHSGTDEVRLVLAEREKLRKEWLDSYIAPKPYPVHMIRDISDILSPFKTESWTEERPLILGGVAFWMENDKWVYDIPKINWDLKELEKDLTVAYSHLMSLVLSP
jgi:hypothetical protein